jgi:hypothetical protein
LQSQHMKKDINKACDSYALILSFFLISILVGCNATTSNNEKSKSVNEVNHAYAKKKRHSIC